MRRDSFVAVDPGVKYFAWCAVERREILNCGLWAFDRRAELRSLYEDMSLIVIETQKVHSMKSKDDVVPLAQAAGAIAYQFPEQYWIWNTTPKAQRWEQTKKRLKPFELRLLDQFNKEEQGHLKDAFAFAVLYLRR